MSRLLGHIMAANSGDSVQEGQAVSDKRGSRLLELRGGA